MSFLRKAFRGIKKVFKKIAPVLGVIAAIAVPFVAPMVGAALGVSTAVGGAIAGAVSGGVIGGLSGGGIKGALLGAALGGAGGYFTSGGTLSGLTGGGAAGSGLAGSPVGTAAQSGLAGATSSSALQFGAAVPYGAEGVVTTGLGAATGGSSIAQLGASLAQGLDVTKLAQLGMTMFGKSFTDLTPSEKQALQETAQLAATNRQLFEQRVAAAQAMLQQGVPNPEVGYAQGARPALLQEEERQRAMAASGGTRLAREASGRKGQIEAARMGTLGAYKEGERAQSAQATGLQMLTSVGQAPATASMMRMPIEEAQRKREADWYQQMAGATAGLLAPTHTRQTAGSTQSGGLFSGLFPA